MNETMNQRPDYVQGWRDRKKWEDEMSRAEILSRWWVIAFVSSLFIVMLGIGVVLRASEIGWPALQVIVGVICAICGAATFMFLMNSASNKVDEAKKVVAEKWKDRCPY